MKNLPVKVTIKPLDKTARVAIGVGLDKDAQFDRLFSLDPGIRNIGPIQRVGDVVFYIALEDIDRFKAGLEARGADVHVCQPEAVAAEKPILRPTKDNIRFARATVLGFVVPIEDTR